jgi:hypothetical protein
MSSRRYTVFRDEQVVAPVGIRASDELRRLLYVLALLAVVTGLVVLYLSQAGRVARKKETMWRLEGEIQDAKLTNIELMLEISKAQDLKSLQGRARSLGFEEARSVQYVDVTVSPASKALTAAGHTEAILADETVELPPWARKIIWQFTEWARTNMARAAVANPQN